VENVSYAKVKTEFLRELNKKDSVSGWAYRLRTEDEWEYCCRAGATSAEDCSYDFYLERPTNKLSQQQTNFGGLFAGKTVKVGSYPPNRLGLYDMHENVWEWCEEAPGSGDSRPTGAVPSTPPPTSAGGRIGGRWARSIAPATWAFASPGSRPNSSPVTVPLIHDSGLACSPAVLDGEDAR
jgi:formylglycine-generating enzyme required for sulfatase activity